MIASPERFEVVETPAPRLHGENEILVRTAVCGICSGDLMPWYLQNKVGTVLGHEIAGWAIEVGSEVSHVRPGDLVFLHHHAPCLACAACERGAFVHCPTWRASKLDPGGMAEFIRVPAVIARVDAFAVPGLAIEQAVFIEPLACCVKALQRVPRLPGSRGVVVGCGVMGLLNLMTSLALGAHEVVAVEPDPERQHKALTCGAAEVLTPEEAERSLAASAEFVVIGPGHSNVIHQSLAYVRPGGTAVLFTPTPAGVQTSLDLGDLYFREISLVPSYSCGPVDTRFAYELLRERRIQPQGLVTHRFHLHDIQRAYDTARAGGAALKVLVVFDGEKP